MLSSMKASFNFVLFM